MGDRGNNLPIKAYADLDGLEFCKQAVVITLAASEAAAVQCERQAGSENQIQCGGHWTIRRGLRNSKLPGDKFSRYLRRFVAAKLFVEARQTHSLAFVHER